MKELLLILNKEDFNEVYTHEVETEIRPFSDFYIDKLLDFDKDGNWSVKEFDTVRFASGYGKNRPEIVVECKGVFVEHDEVGEGEEFTEENAQFVIDLGEILEEKNC